MQSTSRTANLAATSAAKHVEFSMATKRFGDVTALDNLNLCVAPGEVVVLLGPSGCGKSTALQLVNRMLDPDEGRILIDGVDIAESDPVALRRDIGYVIQQIGLFPHLDVAKNVATVCRLHGWSRRDTAARVSELLDLVGLPEAEYAHRYPHQLSGGQQQRVGVARALACAPPILLMDEPFGALDPQIRRGLQGEFRSWVERLGTTVLFVSHDVDEALIVGDRLAVFDGSGGIAQVGAPLDVLSHPANQKVIDYLGPDRLLKRLGVLPVDPYVMHPMDQLDSNGARTSPRMHENQTVQDALLLLLEDAHDAVIVVGDSGGDIGWLDLAALGQQVRLMASASVS